MVPKHYPGMIFLIILTLALQVTTIILHYSATSAARKVLKIPSNWFYNDATLLNNKYLMKISPSEWLDYFWVVIFFFQMMWVVYSVSLIFRLTADKRTFLYVQGFMPPWLYMVYCVHLIAHLGRIFAYDRDVQIAATVMSYLMFLCVICCLALSYAFLNKNGAQLLEFGQEVDVYMVRALVQNGLALYMGWMTFLSAMSTGANLAYLSIMVSMKDSCTISLCVIGVITLIYTPLDLFGIDRYVRYTYTWYISLIVGLSGVLVASYEPWERNSVIACVILSIVILGFFLKIAFAIFRRRKYAEPLLYDNETKVPQQYAQPEVTAQAYAYPFAQSQPIAFQPAYAADNYAYPYVQPQQSTLYPWNVDTTSQGVIYVS